MANLGAHQKISRVLPGRPFGDGRDGAYSSATVPTLTAKSCSGASGQKDLAIASAAFANGDVVLIHQSRGTGVGQWEINKIASGGNSTTLTMSENLYYTYTDSGSSQAQVIKIPMYTSATVASGTWAVSSWDQNTGGILVLAANVVATITGDISGVGTTASSGTTAGGSGKGFSGGNGASTTAAQGEGTSGAGSASTAANGSGGGGGYSGSGAAGGGGGGHAATGSNGTANGGGTGGTGGSTSGGADGTTVTFGGGGGGGSQIASWAGTGGGGGGAIIMIFAKDVQASGTTSVTGGNGGTPTSGNYIALGGGGAGGTVLVVCGTGTLGTNKFVSTGGTGAGTTPVGGNGSVGRIAVHHSSTVTGTTNPSFTDVTDTSLYESNAGFIFNMI